MEILTKTLILKTIPRDRKDDEKSIKRENKKSKTTVKKRDR
jgi:hypothetical protein